MPDGREIVLHPEVLKPGALRKDVLQELPQAGDVPLPLANLIEQSALGHGRRHLESLVEGGAGGHDAQFAVQHHQRLADRGDDVLGVIAGRLQFHLMLPQRFLQLLDRRDVGKRHHHPGDHVFHSSVGQDSHVVPATVTGLHLRFLGHQRILHLPGVLDEVVVFEVRRKVAQRTPHVAGGQVDDPGGLRSEPTDAQVVVQEDRGNLAAVQEVLHVAVRLLQFLDLHLQLGVDRLHFFVE